MTNIHDTNHRLQKTAALATAAQSARRINEYWAERGFASNARHDDDGAIVSAINVATFIPPEYRGQGGGAK